MRYIEISEFKSMLVEETWVYIHIYDTLRKCDSSAFDDRDKPEVYAHREGMLCATILMIQALVSDDILIPIDDAIRIVFDIARANKINIHPRCVPDGMQYAFKRVYNSY